MWSCPNCKRNNTSTVTSCAFCGTAETKNYLSSLFKAANWQDVTIGTADGQDVKLSYDKRTQGIALIGKNGTGKSSLIHTILSQELQGSETTLLLFDPHGELAQGVLKTTKTANKQIRWITPDTTTPFGLNLLEADPQNYEEVERTVNVTIEIFKKLIGNDASYMPRFEYIMGSVIRTIIYANVGYTLAEVPLLLTDLQFSKNVSQKLINPELKRFWQEYERSFWDKSGKEVRPHDRFIYIESVANRISTLLQNELLYRIVSHTKSTIRFDELLESGDLIIFSLPMGKLGEGATSLLGSILLAKLAEAVYSRGTGKHRVHLYIDEYGRYFSTPFTADLLTQGRKYNVSTLVTMQTLQQLPDEQNMAAVLNAGNLLAFASIGKDADVLSHQFPLPGPLPDKTDLLTPYTISPTPVQDIWKKGHPSEKVMELRNSLIVLLHRMESEPYEKVFICPGVREEEGRALQEKFTDMEDYCSNREQITEGFNKLNELLVLCEGGNISNDPQDWKTLVFYVILFFRGYMGVYPQNHKETEGEYADWLHTRSRKNLVDPRQLAKDYEWIGRKMPKYELDPLFDLYISAADDNDDMSLFNKRIAAYGKERVISIMDSFATEYILFTSKYHFVTKEKKILLCADRATWEMENLLHWYPLLRNAAAALGKSPVMTQASTYTGGRTWERSTADMREELAMRIASLPSYTAICQLLQDDGSTQSMILKCLKG